MPTPSASTEEVIAKRVITPTTQEAIPEQRQRQGLSFDLIARKRLSTSRRLQSLLVVPFILLTKAATAATAPLAMPRITTIPAVPNTAMSSRLPRDMELMRVLLLYVRNLAATI